MRLKTIFGRGVSARGIPYTTTRRGEWRPEGGMEVQRCGDAVYLLVVMGVRRIAWWPVLLTLLCVRTQTKHSNQNIFVRQVHCGLADCSRRGFDGNLSCSCR